ncbi:MAG: hypothetical protein C4K49_11385 [Candidatus Thorarchaeota archaeon]|nr:MAG: hypothetical protein C4K49_11385 [Candidatus Thorarchaeota archaeon]
MLLMHINATNVGVIMPEGSLADLEKKVDRLKDELDDIKSDVKALSQLPSIAEGVESIGSEMAKLQAQSSMSDKLEELLSYTQSIESSMKEVAGSKETEVLFKKIDDILISVKDLGSSSQEIGGLEGETTLGKKIDDLQHYVASLSTLEEKFGDLSDAFAETKEIVGIIVRQLDDIERKYNKTLEDVNKALEMVLKVTGVGAKVEPAKATPKAESKEPQPTESAHTEEPGSDVSTTASVDELIDGLLKLVRPRTNADRMSRALEDTRDKLTALVPSGTPVLYQFGKFARELKSYPPTATLNENDIARLNKEIRGWAQKLKELAKSD